MAATTKKTGGYIETVGRRKTSIARARLTPAPRTGVLVNNKDVNAYFPTDTLRMTALEPLLKITLPGQFEVTVVVTGGGISGQATAVRHAISRALIDHDITLRGAMKAAGYLKRDPRAKERRKPGLLKARKRKQWSKR